MAQVFSFGKRKFCVWPEFEEAIGSVGPSLEYHAATIIHTGKDAFTEEDLEEVVTRFRAQDDVWDTTFLEFIILLTTSSAVTVDCPQPSRFILKDQHAVNFPDGPALLQPASGKLQALAALVDDPAGAFIGGGVVPNARDKTYDWLGTDRIAVPSRLYYKRSEAAPLAGFRYAIKDVIDIAGLETGCGNRYYRTLCAPAAESAPYIERLRQAGAVFVGKAACAEFFDGQDPADRFQYATPWNPRGDGFQAPSSSSSGSAAACAAYSWLDFTIGTDTGGSVRHPAGVNGVYGLRPTIGAIPTRGVVATRLMDTDGMFSRSANVLRLVNDCMADKSSLQTRVIGSHSKFKLICLVQRDRPDHGLPPKWFPKYETEGPGSVAQPLFENVLQQIEQDLGCTRVELSVEELWDKTRPEGSPAYADITSPMYERIVYSTLARDVIDPFEEAYRQANDGRTPYLEPILQARIEYGRNVTGQEYDEAVKLCKLFSIWVRDVLLSCAADADETPLLVFPQSWGVPFYRDTVRAPDADLFVKGFSVFALSYCSGCPDVTVPVGEVAYHSRVTRREEFLPVAMSMLTEVGMDDVLLGLLSRWEAGGILRAVNTGSRLYEL